MVNYQHICNTWDSTPTIALWQNSHNAWCDVSFVYKQKWMCQWYRHILNLLLIHNTVGIMLVHIIHMYLSINGAYQWSKCGNIEISQARDHIANFTCHRGILPEQCRGSYRSQMLKESHLVDQRTNTCYNFEGTCTNHD